MAARGGSLVPWPWLRTVPARMWRLSRAHWMILVLLAAGAALRVVVHLAYQPALIYIDSIRYLGMTRTFEPSGVDPLGYPVLMLSWLLPFHDLALVALVQQLLGLAMGVGIYVLLRRWQVRGWLAALAAAPVLLDGYQLQIEQNIMSDTLFEALVLAALGVLLWRRRPPPWALAAGGSLLGLAATVRYVGVVLAAVAVCAVLLVGRSTWRYRCGALALVLTCFMAPLFVYASWSYRSGAGFSFQPATGGNMMYGRTAPVSDCGRLAAAGAPDHVVRVCPPEPVDRRKGPDFYANDRRSPGRIVPAPPSMTRQDVMGAFGLWVVRNQPWDVGYVVVRDFAKGFAPTRTRALNDVALERWRFQVSYPVFPPQDPARITREYGGEDPRVNPGAARFLRDYQSVGYTPGPVLAVAMIAGLLGAAGVRVRRASRRPAPGLWVACLLPSLTGLGLLLLSAAFLFSWRYQLPALVLFPLAGALGVTALVGGAGDPRAGRSASSPPPATRPGRESVRASDDHQVNDHDVTPDPRRPAAEAARR